MIKALAHGGGMLMPQTLKRLPVLTVPPQWCFNQPLRLVDVAWAQPPPYLSLPAASIHVAQSVILDFAGLELITPGEVGTMEVLVKYDANWV